MRSIYKFQTCCDVSLSVQRKNSYVGLEEKYWVNLDGVDYLYKVDDGQNSGYGELVYSHIGNLTGFNCVNCYPAYDKEDDTKGVMVESFLQKGKTTISCYKFLGKYFDSRRVADLRDEIFLYSEWKEQLLAIAKGNGYVLDKNILIDMKKILLMDFIFGNTDRHLQNVEFFLEKNEEGKIVVSLTPCFDNGFALGLWDGYERYKNCKNFENVYMPYFTFYDMEKQKQGLKGINNVAYSIAMEIGRDSRLRDFFNDLKSLDIRKELRYVEMVGGYKFDAKTMKVMEDLVESRIERIEMALQKYVDSYIFNDKNSSEEMTL